MVNISNICDIFFYRKVMFPEDEGNEFYNQWVPYSIDEEAEYAQMLARDARCITHDYRLN